MLNVSTTSSIHEKFECGKSALSTISVPQVAGCDKVVLLVEQCFITPLAHSFFMANESFSIYDISTDLGHSDQQCHVLLHFTLLLYFGRSRLVMF